MFSIGKPVSVYATALLHSVSPQARHSDGNVTLYSKGRPLFRVLSPFSSYPLESTLSLNLDWILEPVLPTAHTTQPAEWFDAGNSGYDTFWSGKRANYAYFTSDPERLGQFFSVSPLKFFRVPKPLSW